MKKTEVMVGAWTPYHTELSQEAKEVFHVAFKGFNGINYTPFAYATQVVEGTNYRYFCNAKGVYPNAINEVALVEIYQPMNGVAYITEIKNCYK